MQGDLLLNGEDRSTHLWSMARPRELRVLVDDDVRGYGCTLSPDGRTALIPFKGLKLIDVATGALLRSFPLWDDRGIKTIAFSPDGRRVLVGTGWLNERRQRPIQTVRMFDLLAGRVLHKSSDPATHVMVVRLLSGDRGLVADYGGDVGLWDLKQGTKLATLKRTTNLMRAGILKAMDVDASEEHALVGDDKGRITLWNLERREKVRTFTHPERPTGLYKDVDAVSLSIAPDGQTALSGGDDGKVRQWDLPTGELRQTFAAHPPKSNVMALRHSPDGRWAVSCGQQSIRTWNLRTGRQIRVLRFPDRIFEASIHPDCRLALLKTWRRFYLLDLTRTADYLRLVPNKPEDPKDPTYLAQLGEYYAFRGVWDWAAICLKRARAGGAKVSALTLARCLWHLNSPGFRAEVRRARDAKEAPDAYLALFEQAQLRR